MKRASPSAFHTDLNAQPRALPQVGPSLALMLAHAPHDCSFRPWRQEWQPMSGWVCRVGSQEH